MCCLLLAIVVSIIVIIIKYNKCINFAYVAGSICVHIYIVGNDDDVCMTCVSVYNSSTVWVTDI